MYGNEGSEILLNESKRILEIFQYYEMLQILNGLYNVVLVQV